MSMPRTAGAFLFAALSVLCISASGAAQTPPAAPTTPPKPVYSHTPSVDDTYRRDPDQPVDQAYSDAIKRYTTDSQFSSPLVDYLPASTTVPTPMKTLGVIAGAPDYLPYAEDVYKYFRALAAASPRVKVFTIGHTEEGREMIAVAIADEKSPERPEGQRRAPGATGRPAHHRPRRRQGQGADPTIRAGLLHHRHHPLVGDRRAHGADGDGLSAGG